jgi:hypothetical protein
MWRYTGAAAKLAPFDKHKVSGVAYNDGGPLTAHRFEARHDAFKVSPAAHQSSRPIHAH